MIGQKYKIVSYDLAISLKAYSIQKLESSRFGDILILLGNFYIELAFFGAIRTLMDEGELTDILAEAGLLAAGSYTGFVKGKYYERYTPLHEIVALTLETKLFKMYLAPLPCDERAKIDAVLDRGSGRLYVVK